MFAADPAAICRRGGHIWWRAGMAEQDLVVLVSFMEKCTNSEKNKKKENIFIDICVLFIV